MHLTMNNKDKIADDHVARILRIRGYSPEREHAALVQKVVDHRTADAPATYDHLTSDMFYRNGVKLADFIHRETGTPYDVIFRTTVQFDVYGAFYTMSLMEFCALVLPDDEHRTEIEICELLSVRRVGNGFVVMVKTNRVLEPVFTGYVDEHSVVPTQCLDEHQTDCCLADTKEFRTVYKHVWYS